MIGGQAIALALVALLAAVNLAGTAQAQPQPCGKNVCTTIILHAADEIFPGCVARA